MIRGVCFVFCVCALLSSLCIQASGQEAARVPQSITLQNSTNMRVLVNATPSLDEESLRGGVRLAPNGRRRFTTPAHFNAVFVMASTHNGHWAADWFPVNRTVYVKISGNRMILSTRAPR